MHCSVYQCTASFLSFRVLAGEPRFGRKMIIMESGLAQFFISVAGVIIMILLAAIAYFLQKWISSTDSLTESVHELRTAVALLQTNQGNNDKTCNMKHDVINNRLNAHSEKLTEHSESIAALEATVTKR